MAQVQVERKTYKNPQVLVSTEWLAENLKNPQVTLLEVDYEPEKAYELGHIPGAGLVSWKNDLNDAVKRDIIDQTGFEQLLGRFGITADSTVVLYGDFNNWFAAFAFWTFKLYGFKDIRLLNGGRKKWAEEGRDYTTDAPSFRESSFTVTETDFSLRAFLPNVKEIVGKDGWGLVDVRSPAEFSGEITAPPEYPTEGARVGGHIPGAANISWGLAVNEDGSFKSYEELENLYSSNGITPDKSIVAYCRIGERSSHTWFVLKYLLGYENVVNYDGSWSEWGNAVGVPVEKGG